MEYAARASSTVLWYWHAWVGTHTRCHGGHRLKHGLTMFTTILTVLWVGLLRHMVVQAEAHFSVRRLQRMIAHLPGDRTARPSPGIPAEVFYLLSGGRVLSSDRIWFGLFFFSRGHRVHPADAMSRVVRVEVPSATVHELRLFLATARQTYLSPRERATIDAVQMRCFDLRDLPDSSGPGPDDGHEYTPLPKPPVISTTNG